MEYLVPIQSEDKQNISFDSGSDELEECRVRC